MNLELWLLKSSFDWVACKAVAANQRFDCDPVPLIATFLTRADRRTTKPAKVILNQASFKHAGCTKSIKSCRSTDVGASAMPTEPVSRTTGGGPHCDADGATIFYWHGRAGPSKNDQENQLRLSDDHSRYKISFSKKGRDLICQSRRGFEHATTNWL